MKRCQPKSLSPGSVPVPAAASSLAVSQARRIMGVTCPDASLSSARGYPHWGEAVERRYDTLLPTHLEMRGVQ